MRTWVQRSSTREKLGMVAHSDTPRLRDTDKQILIAHWPARPASSVSFEAQCKRMQNIWLKPTATYTHIKKLWKHLKIKISICINNIWRQSEVLKLAETCMCCTSGTQHCEGQTREPQWLMAGPECTASCTAAWAKCDTVLSNEQTPKGNMCFIIKIKVHNWQQSFLCEIKLCCK